MNRVAFAVALVCALAACHRPGGARRSPGSDAAPTDAAAPRAPSTVATPDAERPRFGTKSLAPGFLPDPDRTYVVSGGALDASGLAPGTANCAGFVSRAPDLAVELVARSASLHVAFLAARRGATAALVLRDAGGRWHCDVARGPDHPSPQVDLEGASAGRYLVWVGGVERGVPIEGTVTLTELASPR